MKKLSFTFLLLLFCTLIIFSHKPVFDDELHHSFESALEIKSPQVSQITYHEFSEEEPVFWIKFKVVKGESIKIVLTTPYHEKYSDFEMNMTVFSENGGVVLRDNKGEIDKLHFDFPKSFEYLTVKTIDYENRFFHEPFSNTDSWFLLTDYLIPEESGMVYIALYPFEEFKNFGKVGFSVGVLERFLPLDLLMLGSWLEQIREFHEE